MDNNYLGEIRIFSGNFAPKGWAFCNGQLLPINQNQALFAILGTVYGGDGVTTFALPDMRGRIALHWGSNQGGVYNLGQKAGTENVTLTTAQMPAHIHPVMASNTIGTSGTPSGNLLGISKDNDGNGFPMYATTANTTMNANAVGVTGGSQPHENRQPSMAITFIVALTGIFPSRN
jgi:microcystin-dependent protein